MVFVVTVTVYTHEVGSDYATIALPAFTIAIIVQTLTVAIESQYVSPPSLLDSPLFLLHSLPLPVLILYRSCLFATIIEHPLSALPSRPLLFLAAICSLSSSPLLSSSSSFTYCIYQLHNIHQSSIDLGHARRILCRHQHRQRFPRSRHVQFYEYSLCYCKLLALHFGM